VLQSIFGYSERVGVDYECDRQTDGWTDILVASAALDYVMRPKMN